MKRYLLLTFAATFFLFLISSSQGLSKKDKLFGASTSLSFYFVNTSPQVIGDIKHYNNVALIPSYAWVVKNNLAFGIKGNVSVSRQTQVVGSGKNKYSTLNIGPEIFLKKYRTLSQNFGVFFNNGIYFSYINTRQKNSGDFLKSNTWGGGYNFTPGVFYQFTERFLGEANIGGLSASYSKVDGGREEFGIGASFLNYFNIGLQYVIRKNKS
jgi:hypothetical protein